MAKYRIRSSTDDIGTYWWIEQRLMGFWWQLEPGYHISLESVKRRLAPLLRK
jgi:hypothetical protein